VSRLKSSMSSPWGEETGEGERKSNHGRRPVAAVRKDWSCANTPAADVNRQT
jgi:hypothetical protein